VRKSQLLKSVWGVPFDASTEVGRAEERRRRAMLTAITSLGVRGSAALIALASVPLTAGYLGMERYGMWVTITSNIAMLSFADFGIGNGLVNAVALAMGRGDRDAMRHAAASAFFLLSATACLFAAVLAVAYQWIPWASLLNAKSDLARSEAGPASLALAGCFLLSLPLGIVQRIQTGSQEGFVNDFWLSAGSLLSLFSLVVGLHLKWSLPSLILAVSAAPVATTLLNGVSLFYWGRRWLLPRWKNFRWLVAKMLARQGFFFFLLQIGYVISMSSDNLIVAHVMGAAAVPQYAVTQRAFLLVVSLQSAWLAPLWPAYGEAIQRGDIDWVRSTLLRSIVGSVLIASAASLALTVISRPLFKIWVGAELIPSWPLTIGFAFWAVVQAGGTAVAMFLNGSNTLQFEVCVSIALVAGGTPLKILLCKQSGLAGVVWGQLVAYLFVVALPFALVLPKILAQHANAQAVESVAVASS
jgi:O-antigen/teichoic acid export membrane protein